MQGTIDVVAMPAEDPKPMGSLGPMAGAWDGYADLAPDAAMRAKALVGHIHAQAETCARAAIDIGLRLITLKELLPHGQFIACVKAEFGWTGQWAGQLMQVADRFSNRNSSFNLPSSARVLALLASSDADDATVAQAAQERWTVAETKRRVGRSGAPRPPQPTEALALSIIRKGEVERHRAALALAEQAQELDAQGVMDEIHLRQLPKGSVIYGVTADFHRLKDDRWVRLPHAGQIDVMPQQLEVIEPEPVPVAEYGAKVLNMEQAAAALGLAVTSLRTLISPKQVAAKGPLVRNGWRASKAGRGMIRLEQVNE
jgi:hypothetical protein